MEVRDLDNDGLEEMADELVPVSFPVALVKNIQRDGVALEE